MSRFVYFVRDGEFVKVGMATNYQSRIAALQTGNVRQLEVVEVFDVSEHGLPAQPFEALMHRLLRPYWARGEWFKITNSALRTICDYAWSLCHEVKCPECGEKHTRWNCGKPVPPAVHSPTPRATAPGGKISVYTPEGQFDKKSWMREYMREYMRNKRALAREGNLD